MKYNLRKNRINGYIDLYVDGMFYATYANRESAMTVVDTIAAREGYRI